MWIAHKFIHTHIRSHFKIDEPKSPQAALKENEKTKKQYTSNPFKNETMGLYRASLPKRLLVTCFLENLCRGGSYTPASLSLIKLGFMEL